MLDTTMRKQTQTRTQQHIIGGKDELNIVFYVKIETDVTTRTQDIEQRQTQQKHTTEKSKTLINTEPTNNLGSYLLSTFCCFFI